MAKSKLKLPDTVGERIIFFRERAGFTQADLALACGWVSASGNPSQARVNHYETGRRTPGQDDVKAIAAALGVSPITIEYGEITRSLTVTRALPILSWKELSRGDVMKKNAANGQLSIFWPTQVSEESFVLPVTGDDYKPEFKSGDMLIVDPRAQPRHNDFVIVSINNEKPALYKYTKQKDSFYFCRLDGVSYLIPQVKKTTRIFGVVLSKIVSYR